MGRKDIAFFRGLNKTAAFARLSEFFIKEAVLFYISEEFDVDSFVIENHQDRCVTFSSPKTIVFVLLENDAAVISATRKAQKEYAHLDTYVVTIELDNIFISKDQINLKVHNIINAAVQMGVPRNNLFLKFLKELFDIEDN
jgi:propanediol dehydratase large subunit